jgi:A/G-specific adenine glycosylase
MDKAQRQYFTRQLMHWHVTGNYRALPWKEEKDPYKIWLSEVILQQTRAEQGLPYYLRFTEQYPTVKHLAAAKDEDVFRLWQGLGYYNRCRNMLASARYIATELEGKFPKEYEQIAGLKGVGSYTAAAIASFGYGLPYAVLDGNVYRVLSRYFGIDTPIDGTAGKKEFGQLAQELLDTTDSAGYNQAIMDIGATVCKPAAPLCGDCPLQKKCFARKHAMTADLPVKSKKLTVKKRYFHYVFLLHDGKLWVRKRTANDIWQNLHEPLMVEHTALYKKEELLKDDAVKMLKLKAANVAEAGEASQRLTHRIIEQRFYIAKVKTKPGALPGDGAWVDFKELNKYAFPKSIVSFLEKKSYFY